MLLLDQFHAEQSVCPYFSDRPFHSENLVTAELEAEEYLGLLGQFYRRSGRVLYRPTCSWCRECVPLRVLVQEFSPSRSQTRAWRRNEDLRVVVTTPQFDPRHLELYEDYRRRKHASSEPSEGVPDILHYWSFLVDSPLSTLEFQYWAGETLVGVGIVDDLGSASSSVYFYYDMDHGSRSLGVYSLLFELDWARRRGYGHHYLGYWVRESRTMAYKSRYRPSEVLSADGLWTRLEAGS